MNTIALQLAKGLLFFERQIEFLFQFNDILAIVQCVWNFLDSRLLYSIVVPFNFIVSTRHNGARESRLIIVKHFPTFNINVRVRDESLEE